MKIRSLYFPESCDEADAGWTRETCNELVDSGNNVFYAYCCGEKVEYAFNEDFTLVEIIISGQGSRKIPVNVTFED